MLKTAEVYVRPDLDSSHCAFLRNGIAVAGLRRAVGFTQVCYEEFDRMEEPHYITMSITGWVLDEALADTRRRHFFHLEFEGETAEQWTVQTDHHRFTLFWVPLSALPQIISPQDEWLAFLKLTN